jgi:hypothetical protein
MEQVCTSEWDRPEGSKSHVAREQVRRSPETDEQIVILVSRDQALR